jgi:hypothetical protein
MEMWRDGRGILRRKDGEPSHDEDGEPMPAITRWEDLLPWHLANRREREFRKACLIERQKVRRIRVKGGHAHA